VRAPGVGGASAQLPRASGGARVETPAPRTGGGADVRLPETRGTVRAPGLDGRFDAPGTRAGARIDAPAARANIDNPGIRTERGFNLPPARADVRGDADLRAPGISSRTGVTGEARTTLRPQIDADGRVRAATGIRSGDLSNFRTTFGRAVNAQAAADRAAVRDWLAANPARARYWGNWGSSVRNGFLVGQNPYFNTGFWGGQNLVGLGLGNGFSIGGFGPGYGTGWWGYSPWLGNRPWSYWYGNPGWNTFAGSYGWNTPFYYDYGPSGNVVFYNDRVFVNEQPVGTVDEFYQSARDLAHVTQEEMNMPHDWMPLGTFSVATSQNESNPDRVIQLAHDNREGLISGTIFNRKSGNLYTVQGKVDPQTQRVAFTIGNDPNVVMETGLFNLTKDETPVLVHFAPEKTATYLFVRLPEPESTQQPAATASAPPAEAFPR
jgi:hypothetical protein